MRNLAFENATVEDRIDTAKIKGLKKVMKLIVIFASGFHKGNGRTPRNIGKRNAAANIWTENFQGI